MVGVLRPLEAREARSRAELGAAGAAAEIAALADPITDPRCTRCSRARASGWAFAEARSSIAAPTVSPPPSRSSPGGSVLRSRRATRFARDGSGSSDSRCWPGAPCGAAAEVLGEVEVRRWRPRGGWGSLEARTAVLFVPFAVLVSALAELVLVRLLVRRLRSIEVLASRVAEGTSPCASRTKAETRSDGWRGSWTA